MAVTRHVGAFVGGLLVGNSAPHLATAVTGRTHLTPLAGKDSSPAVNLVWGLGNALGGLALARACQLAVAAVTYGVGSLLGVSTT
ncbi:MAG TPA: hypothetical protein VGY96_18415 [Streptosporangiaceae bacterium]|jgi:hypothetical protein|nr:hypothetical protein [Streptosporangiaceae bacterium]